MHHRDIEQNPRDQRRRLAGLLMALDAQENPEARQLFLELTLSYLVDVHPEVAKVAWTLARATRGRDWESQPESEQIDRYRGRAFDSGKEFCVDLFVLAVKDVERQAVLDAFRPRAAGEGYAGPDGTDLVTGRDVWLARAGGRSVGIGWVNGDGLVEAAVAMAQYSQFVSFHSACLVGMAGGSRKYDLGSVIIANVVHDYDRRKVTPGKPRKRPKRSRHAEEHGRVSAVGAIGKTPPALVNPPRSAAERRSVRVPSELIARAEDLNSRQGMEEWWSLVAEEMPDWTIPPVKRPWQHISVNPQQMRGSSHGIIVKPLLSGGALVEVELEFQRLLSQYDEEAAGLDMESYGFARWCEVNRVKQWLVLRGISDHCGPSPEGRSEFAGDQFAGNERPKGWQYPATYRAARLLRDHLMTRVLWPPDAEDLGAKHG